MTFLKKKYHPFNANAQSWEYIQNRYIEDWGGQHIQMIKLVKHIQKSEFANRIFGSTSMDKLVIGNCNPIDYGKEALHITFDLNKRTWRFAYKEEPFQDPKFVRDYPEEVGIEKFDNFIKMIRW